MNWLDDLLKEFPEISKAKKRLQYWQDRYSDLEKENRSLRDENGEFERKIKGLKEQLEAGGGMTGFVEAEGVLWKKKPAGGYENHPYCPRCKLPMSPSPPMLPVFISCLKCSFNAPFVPDNLKRIISELPE